MEKKIKYSALSEVTLQQVKNGERLILISEAGEELAALVPLRHLEFLHDCDAYEDACDIKAVIEIKKDPDTVWHPTFRGLASKSEHF